MGYSPIPASDEADSSKDNRVKKTVRHPTNSIVLPFHTSLSFMVGSHLPPGG
jgi:hypothetical protein